MSDSSTSYGFDHFATETHFDRIANDTPPAPQHVKRAINKELSILEKLPVANRLQFIRSIIGK